VRRGWLDLASAARGGDGDGSCADEVVRAEDVAEAHPRTSPELVA